MANLSTFFDMIMIEVTTAPGTGSFTLGTAWPGFQGTNVFPSGNTNVSYSAWDGVNWETAHGVVNKTGSTYTLSRGVDTLSSSNSNALVNFGSNVLVEVTVLSQDLNALLSTGAAQTLTISEQLQGQQNLGAMAAPSATFLNSHSVATSNTVSVSVGIPIPIGSYLVAAVFDTATTPGTMADSAGNTYANDTFASPAGSTANGVLSIFGGQITAALTSSDSLTYSTNSGNSTDLLIAVFLVTGAPTQAQIDAACVHATTGTGTAVSVSTGTPSAPAETVLAFFAANAALTAPAGQFITQGSASLGWASALNVSAIKTETATVGSSAAWAAITIGVKNVAGNSGNVVGPINATDADIALFNGSTGKLLYDSDVPIGRVPAAAAAWTPTDQSGAGLTFTNITCVYQQIGTGGMVLVAGAFQFPTTANGSNAVISIPVACNYGIPLSVEVVAYVPMGMRTLGGGATAEFYNFETGGVYTNSNLSTLLVRFGGVYF